VVFCHAERWISEVWLRGRWNRRNRPGNTQGLVTRKDEVTEVGAEGIAE
jgi:hypothetical protein